MSVGWNYIKWKKPYSDIRIRAILKKILSVSRNRWIGFARVEWSSQSFDLIYCEAKIKEKCDKSQRNEDERVSDGGNASINIKRPE